MLSGALHAIGFRPHEVPADLLRLLVGVGYECLEEVTEVLWPRLVTGLQSGVDIDLLQPHGDVEDCPKVHVRMAVLGGPYYTLRAASPRKPDVRVGLLHGQHPRVDRPVLVILLLMPEGTRRGPALDDEVMGFLKPSLVLRGINARLEGLYRGPAYKAGDNP